MTISSSVARVTFNCDGSTQTFPVPMQAYLATDFLVIHNSTALVLNSDYTMVASGTLNPQLWSMSTTLVYPPTDKLQVILNPTQTQLTQYVTNQAFPSPAVQANVDRLTQMVIRLQDKLSRAVIAPDIDVSPAVQLPAASARANTYQGYDANGNLLLFNLLLSGAVLSTATLAPFLGLSITAQEIAAGVVPFNSAYPELDVRRYGAFSGNSAAQNTTALQSGISVLAQHQYGELLIPQGLTLNVTQVNFTAMSQFNLRCDGTLFATAASPGPQFTNLSSSQGFFTPVKFSNCTGFRVYGKGYINNGFVDAVFITGCTDFDWSLDCRGSCTNAPTATGNSTMNGMTIVNSTQFSLHHMTVDSVTSQNMNNSTDVFYQWANNIFLSGCTDFELGPSIISRKAGYGAFYIGSNCFDFDVHNNTGEFCSGTACTIAWSGGGSMAQRFTVSGNLWRYNQEDSFCISNQSGTNASIGATVTSNVSLFPGWCNCSQGTTAPASSGGAGINCQFIDDLTIGHNASTEHTTAALYLFGCARVSGDVGTITQQIATGPTVIGLTILNGAQDINLTGGTIFCGGLGAQSLLMSGTNADVQLSHIALPAGQISLSGSYSGCKMTGLVAVCPQAVSAPCDFIDCTIGVTTAGQNGIVAGNPNVKLVRTSGGASGSGSGIVCNGVNDVTLEDCTGTATGTGFGISVINSNGVNLRGCLGNGNSGNAISVAGNVDRIVLIGCKGNSVGGNALNMNSASITNATLISFRALVGAVQTSGTNFLTGMNVP